ncbi:hypothetical protein, partial [Enterobacter hormaechei]|uniref:hypothetical protein n=1 Tax=Enterobacter hormaechei TaxID=158836 RepID=UPI001952CDCC
SVDSSDNARMRIDRTPVTPDANDPDHAAFVKSDRSRIGGNGRPREAAGRPALPPPVTPRYCAKNCCTTV